MKPIPTFEEFIFESLWEAEDKDKQSTDRSPIDSEKIETALKNKSEETGLPIGILRAVWRRGAAAWKSGHRPGAGQEQWAYARVNSFATKSKGTWGKADADLAKEVRDGGHDKKLKEGYFSGISDSTADKKKAQMKKQAAMDDDDPEAYKELPGDTKGKKNLKTSKHTSKYHELYGEGLSFFDFISEKNIAKIKEEIPIVVDLDTTNHAEERKTRHGEENPITDEQIIQTVDKALETIGKNQVKGEDKIGQKYWIYDKTHNDLNVIGKLNKRSDKELVFVVITVMREKNFRGSPDAKKIDV